MIVYEGVLVKGSHFRFEGRGHEESNMQYLDLKSSSERTSARCYGRIFRGS